MDKETKKEIRQIVRDEINEALEENRRWFLREFENR